MNEDHGLTRENLLRSLPISLSGDPKMVALARVIAGALAVHRWPRLQGGLVGQRLLR